MASREPPASVLEALNGEWCNVENSEERYIVSRTTVTRHNSKGTTTFQNHIRWDARRRQLLWGPRGRYFVPTEVDKATDELLPTLERRADGEELRWCSDGAGRSFCWRREGNPSSRCHRSLEREPRFRRARTPEREPRSRRPRTPERDQLRLRSARHRSSPSTHRNRNRSPARRHRSRSPPARRFQPEPRSQPRRDAPLPPGHLRHDRSSKRDPSFQPEPRSQPHRDSPLPPGHLRHDRSSKRDPRSRSRTRSRNTANGNARSNALETSSIAAKIMERASRYDEVPESQPPPWKPLSAIASRADAETASMGDMVATESSTAQRPESRKRPFLGVEQLRLMAQFGTAADAGLGSSPSPSRSSTPPVKKGVDAASPSVHDFSRIGDALKLL